MKNKEKYYKTLIEDNGQLNEIDLGEKLGLDEKETRELIVRLLSEHKIEYLENGACNYSCMKIAKRKNKTK
ncbi:hypothetical protein ATE84_2977 [Aquimarina sp. MAR_2010_214]|uniref:hypothetical protein n=1 Tax=Aquimarina sp. MAR_2010_214 TaxID=1250026 RepID=UPI000C701E1B|nr:hypothetical protein [Aquimarina sp. MAR_2010_214]PKV50908.1 hypothetical protein ATE84_2977 [Aquimarina sp. MAR_2010_214]